MVSELDFIIGGSATPNLSEVVVCPKCKNRDPNKITTRNTPYEVLRHCVMCGNDWSGGSMAQRELETMHPQEKKAAGIGFEHPPEEDYPDVQYTGAPFRFGPDYEE